VGVSVGVAEVDPGPADGELDPASNAAPGRRSVKARPAMAASATKASTAGIQRLRLGAEAGAATGRVFAEA
jgi:hypothetical protein